MLHAACRADDGRVILTTCLPSCVILMGMHAGQGVYLNEHRNAGGSRSIMVTLQGLKRSDGRKYGPIY